MTKILCFLTGIVLLNSCRTSTDALLPRITGRSGEIIVVMDKSRWEGAVGDTLRKYLAAPFKVLPQEEPRFDLVSIPNAAFTDIFRTHRNILFIEVNKDVSPQLLAGNNKWATPQVIFEFQAPSDTALANLIARESDNLSRLVENAERKRLMDVNAGNVNGEISEALKNKFSIDLVVPGGYTLDVDTTDFVWIAEESGGATMGILVYAFPYTDEQTFTPAYLLNKRTEFTRKFVPGAVSGSFMSVETAVDPTFGTYHLRNKLFVAELRGLWKMENGFMGGPYIHISTPDTLRQRVVCVDGFVFAPNIEKRNYMRQIESILYSLQIRP